MDTTIYIAAYVVLVLNSYALTMAKETGGVADEFPGMMYEGSFAHKPSWFSNLISNVVPFLGLFCVWLVYPTGGFVWPRKGVTYKKPVSK